MRDLQELRDGKESQLLVLLLQIQRELGEHVQLLVREWHQ